MTIIEIKICCLYKERNANKKTEQHASLMFVYTPKKKEGEATGLQRGAEKRRANTAFYCWPAACNDAVDI